MTHTITNVRQGVPGDRRYVIKDVDCTSYPTGGIPLVPGDLGLKSVEFVVCDPKENAKYRCVYREGTTFQVTITTAVSVAGTITMTVNGTAVTYVAAAADTSNDTAAEVGALLRAALNASAFVTGRYTISGTNGVVLLTAKYPYASGNSFAIDFGETSAAASAGVVTRQTGIYVQDIEQATPAETAAATDVGVIRVLAYGLGGSPQQV